MAKSLQEILSPGSAKAFLEKYRNGYHGPSSSGRTSYNGVFVDIDLDAQPSREEADATIEGIRNAPVHHLENVRGDLYRTACGSAEWVSPYRITIVCDDPGAIASVTCPKCLAAMADEPTVVDDTSNRRADDGGTPKP